VQARWWDGMGGVSYATESRGEPLVCAMVAVHSPDEEDQRRLSRRLTGRHHPDPRATFSESARFWDVRQPDLRYANQKRGPSLGEITATEAAGAMGVDLRRRLGMGDL
jgi:hypothetical protein